MAPKILPSSLVSIICNVDGFTVQIESYLLRNDICGKYDLDVQVGEGEGEGMPAHLGFMSLVSQATIAVPE